jgi:hypothetical protein
MGRDMFEYLKFLPLLQVAAKHPGLVQLFSRLLTEVPEVLAAANKLTAMVEPSLPELQQAIAEAEAILQNIYSPSRRSAFDVDKTKPGSGRRKRRNRRVHTK